MWISIVPQHCLIIILWKKGKKSNEYVKLEDMTSPEGHLDLEDGPKEEGNNVSNHESSRNQSPWSDTTTRSLAQVEEKMRRKLKFFFMNPIEKWRAKRAGPLAVYKVDEFYNSLDYAYAGYSNLTNAIGPYSYNDENNIKPEPEFCQYYYKKGIINGFNESYEFNAEIESKCVNFTNVETKLFKSRQYLQDAGLKVDFAALVRAELQFSLKTINFRAAGPITPPDCFRFDVRIVFDNEDHDGQMSLTLEAEPHKLTCKGDKTYITDNKIDQILRSILNILVISICSASLLLCSRAIYRAQLLKGLTCSFFRRAYNTELSLDGQLEFLNVWYIMIIVNDILIIMGSAMKEQIERNQFTYDEWNNNARPHTARVTEAYLNDMNITVMEWPARSPDMNSIEHV
ncbi:jg14103 [Pararge aegeria aegeria]|uniref:Jg14103 protein n=1 Tax=Pararge aegeria aegeria TaxID=348720 RepID=A0A8S4S0W7_9NEOP|nr:jg14103 [Pararge aegeria aegeria]